MTLVVPFDGSELAEAALVRATEFAQVFDEPVLAITVIREGNAEYAREQGWIGTAEEFEMDAIVARLEEQVTDLSPRAEFRTQVVDWYAPNGAIARRIRRVARDVDASMVFLGSENAGHLVVGVSSVGRSVAADESYDVVIVRHRRPAKIAALTDASEHGQGESDFYTSAWTEH
jgi:nucleotide-binding universal stress UspA family protein